MLIVITVLIIASDAWAFFIMMYEPIPVVGLIFGYAVIIVEAVLKLLLLVMFSCWRCTQQKDENLNEEEINTN